MSMRVQIKIEAQRKERTMGVGYQHQTNFSQMAARQQHTNAQDVGHLQRRQSSKGLYANPYDVSKEGFCKKQ